MARTGKRANALRSLLAEAGVTISKGGLPRPTSIQLQEAGLEAEVGNVYRALGGTQSRPRINPGAWDIEVDGIAVELDEDLHFNRYRRITLDSPLYDRLTFARDLYRDLCDEHEADCLGAGQWGKRWTVERAELEFGPAGAPGDFSGSGPPRWKQRAFYDFIKDTAPIAIGVSVSRVPIWETITVDGATYLVGVVLELLADGALPRDGWGKALYARVREQAFSSPPSSV